MRRNKFILSVLLISLLFIVSCGQQEEKSKIKGAFLGGTQGLIAEFEIFGLEEEGFYTIFDTEDFPIEVTLRNKGEHTIKSGDVKVTLLGPSPDEFTGISSWDLQNQDTIGDVTEQGEETITFANEAKYLGEVTGVLPRTWLANIDYNYRTRLILPEICLKGDITDKSVCEIKNDKVTFFASGSPISVKEVRQDAAGKGIMMLVIKISNAGGGKVTKQGEEFGFRETLAFTIDDPAWECKSSGKVNEAKFAEKEAEIRCKLKEALDENFIATKKIELNLDYKYRSTIQEVLNIKESAK